MNIILGICNSMALPVWSRKMLKWPIKHMVNHVYVARENDPISRKSVTFSAISSPGIVSCGNASEEKRTS